LERIGIVEELAERRRAARRIRAKALEILDRSDWNEILELAGSMESSGEASAALKAVLAERITEYTVKAMREARKRGTKLGAAAIIIAATRAK
jgi:maltooligosyltrehalose synthase